MEDVDKENTVTSVFVLTLRVLFVFDKIDLSPKNSPEVKHLTSTASFITLTVPSLINYNAVGSSPSLIINLSLSYFSKMRYKHSFDFMFLSNRLRI